MPESEGVGRFLRPPEHVQRGRCQRDAMFASALHSRCGDRPGGVRHVELSPPCARGLGATNPREHDELEGAAGVASLARRGRRQTRQTSPIRFVGYGLAMFHLDGLASESDLGSRQRVDAFGNPSLPDCVVERGCERSHTFLAVDAFSFQMGLKASVTCSDVILSISKSPSTGLRYVLIRPRRWFCRLGALPLAAVIR